MRYLYLLLATVMVGFVVSCGKKPQKQPSNGGSTGGNVAGLAIAGTEYEGFIIQLAREWPKPMLIHFNADSTVTDYCDFYLIQLDGALFPIDSTIGKIIRTSPGNGDSTSLTIYFKDLADTQVYNISADLSAISGGSVVQTVHNFVIASTLKKITTPAASLEGTYWTCDSIQGSPSYPDINGVHFNTDHLTTYYRNGAEATVGYYPDTIVVSNGYRQTGNRVYFDGYNETKVQNVLFFGVISNDGNNIYADTNDFIDSRLPMVGITDGEYEYGDTGVTPVMKKTTP